MPKRVSAKHGRPAESDWPWSLSGKMMCLVACLQSDPERPGDALDCLLRLLVSRLGGKYLEGVATIRAENDPNQYGGESRRLQRCEVSPAIIKWLNANGMQTAFAGPCFRRQEPMDWILTWENTTRGREVRVAIRLGEYSRKFEKPLDSLPEEFFRIVAPMEGCYYGYADIRADHETIMQFHSTEPDPIDDLPFREALEAQMWTELDERRAKYVRGVYWANFLRRDKLDAIGGVERLRSDIAAMRFGVNRHPARVTELPAGSALIVLFPFHPLLFGTSSSPWLPGHGMTDAAHWLLQRFTGARLLPGFDQTPGSAFSPSASPLRDLPPFPTEAEMWEQPRNELTPTESEYVAHRAAHPPRCARKCERVVSSADRKLVTAHFGRFAVGFRVPEKSRAGHEIWLRANRSCTLVRPPIFVGSRSRARAPFVFDHTRDGFDGAQGLVKDSSEPNRGPTCPRCGYERFHVLVAFQYSGEDEPTMTPKELGRRQDYFDWFGLHMTCAKCGCADWLFDWECA